MDYDLFICGLRRREQTPISLLACRSVRSAVLVAKRLINRAERILNFYSTDEICSGNVVSIEQWIYGGAYKTNKKENLPIIFIPGKTSLKNPQNQSKKKISYNLILHYITAYILMYKRREKHINSVQWLCPQGINFYRAHRISVFDANNKIS